MASLTLCGKKVTNEQAKTIFTVLMAAVVLLVVTVIVMVISPSEPSAPGELPAAPQLSHSTGSGGTWQVQQTVGESDWVRLTGKNARCSAGGCTGRLEVRKLLAHEDLSFRASKCALPAGQISRSQQRRPNPGVGHGLWTLVLEQRRAGEHRVPGAWLRVR